MDRPQRLFSIGIFLCFIHDAVAFSQSKPKHLSHDVRDSCRFTSSLFHSSTPLYYRDERDTTEEHLAESLSSSESRTQDEHLSSDGVSMPLIRAIWFNQASILMFATSVVTGLSFLSGNSIDLHSLHWNGSPGFHSFLDLDLTSLRLVEGFLATLPLISLGSLVEQSDKRDASNVNFSTTNMVISLFGRRRSPEDPTATRTSQVMMLSALVALSTGISEEIVFRGYIPTAIDSLSHSIPFALAGQAALFAFAHISPKSTPGENCVVGGLQFFNGIWYGLVYLATGGDLLPCMIAHMLYDMHILCETWSVVNHQMDYTQEAYRTQLDEGEEEAILRIQQQAGPSLNTQTLSFARRFFYAFDYEHKGSLSLSDVQRAVSYAFLKNKKNPKPETVEEVFERVLETRSHHDLAPIGRLSLSEFLQVLVTLKSPRSVA